MSLGGEVFLHGPGQSAGFSKREKSKEEQEPKERSDNFPSFELSALSLIHFATHYRLRSFLYNRHEKKQY